MKQAIGKIQKFLLFVCDGDGVHALCVGPDDGVGLQAEHDGLGDGADDGHGPGDHQQPPGAVYRGPVADREHYCTQPGVSINSSSNDPFYSHYIIHVIEQCPCFCKRKYVSSWITF